MTGRAGEAIRRLRETVGSSRLKWIAILSGLAYAFLYLFSLGHLIVSPGFTAVDGGGVLHFTGVENLWRERAPYNFEPVGVFQPVEGFALFLAVPNLLLAAVLGLLLGLNVSILVYAYQRTKACGIGSSVGGILGSVPAFLTGFACCSPTFLIVLGAAFSTSFVYFLTWFMPAALAALVGVFAWNLLRTLPTPPGEPLLAQV